MLTQSLHTSIKHLLTRKKLRDLCDKLDKPDATHDLSHTEQESVWSGLFKISALMQKTVTDKRDPGPYPLQFLWPTATMVTRAEEMSKGQDVAAIVATTIGAPTMWGDQIDDQYVRSVV